MSVYDTIDFNCPFRDIFLPLLLVVVRLQLVNMLFEFVVLSIRPKGQPLTTAVAPPQLTVNNQQREIKEIENPITMPDGHPSRQ